ncbi:MAG: hypothetical protein Q8922_03325 [Bacteroidota bacterium]|nr:hypothetical protein [Bacteroidota bacterium]MDP4232997.1 hypothetical protein [Bacteroidota bacterium]MDP4242041.1 hypothetical protein [Bacteroidota bacterium]MDP4286944.1 hypothetical protein [Bacteroidota bacterium]
MNFAHLHLILNHLPVFTTLFGLILVIASGIGDRPAVLRIGLFTLIAGALVAIPAYLTGEPAEGVIEHVSGIAAGSIDAHEEIAGIALAVSVLLGIVATVMAFRMRAQIVPSRSFIVALLALTTVSTSLFGVTAYFGGQIHHTEIASGSSRPVNPSQADED